MLNTLIHWLIYSPYVRNLLLDTMIGWSVYYVLFANFKIYNCVIYNTCWSPFSGNNTIFRLRWSLNHEATSEKESLVLKLVEMMMLLVFPCELIQNLSIIYLNFTVKQDNFW